MFAVSNMAAIPASSSGKLAAFSSSGDDARQQSLWVSMASPASFEKERRALSLAGVRKQGFADALGILSKADLPGSMRKGPLRRAVEVFIENVDGQLRAGTSDVESLGIIDAALSLARKTIGPCSLGEVVRSVLASGQEELARRLENASKARNLRAHPDPLLLRDLCQYFEGHAEDAGALCEKEPLQTDVMQEAEVCEPEFDDGPSFEVFDIATPQKEESSALTAPRAPPGLSFNPVRRVG